LKTHFQIRFRSLFPSIILIFLIFVRCSNPSVSRPPAKKPKVIAAAKGSSDSKSTDGGKTKPGSKKSDPSSDSLNSSSLADHEKVEEIFKSHCLSCHGANETSSGGLANITNLSALIDRKLIIPGKPDESPIYKRMASTTNPMPPKASGTVSSEAMDFVKQWIEKGATLSGTPSGVEFYSEEAQIKEAAQDLANLSAGERQNVRYFSLVAMSNSGASRENLDTLKQATIKLLNSFSKTATVQKFDVVGAGKVLIRVKLDSIGWTAATWNLLTAAYPYQVIPKETSFLAAMQNNVGSSIPIMRADWFVAQASVPPLYFELTGAPTTLAAFETFFGLKLNDATRDRNVLRAGFNNSEVAEFSRVIERASSGSGRFIWHSYEFGSAVGKKNPFENPFGPRGIFGNMAGGKEYEHDGKEIIYQLPNGFLGFYVVNGTGNRMDEAPGRAKGTGSATGLVTVGVGCMSCHAIGLFEKKDQIKPAVLKLAGFSADQLQLLSGLYADDSKIIGQIQADTQSYSSALTAANVDLKAPDPIGRILKKFHDSVDLKSAAGELGATADQVKSAIDGDASLSTTLSALTTGGSINRSLFQARFLDLMRKVYGP
jgi:hypothetical protein